MMSDNAVCWPPGPLPTSTMRYPPGALWESVKTAFW